MISKNTPIYSIKNLYIFTYIFLAEFSFFFALPILSNLDNISGIQVGGVFSIAIVVESIFMVLLPSILRKLSFRFIFSCSTFLMGVAFVCTLLIDGIWGWYGFFSIMAVAKSIGKPFTRVALSFDAPDDKKERLFVLFSFFQNFAIVIAPLFSSFVINQYKVVLGIFASIYFFLLLVTQFLIRKISSSRESQDKGFLNHFKNILENKRFVYLMLSNSFAYFLMGLFIGGTVMFKKYLPHLNSHVGLFFSIVGASICIWQLFISKMKWVNRNPIFLLSLTGVLLSFYFIGQLHLSVVALIAYSVFEATLIPKIYIAVEDCVSSVMLSQFFAFLLVAANIGDGMGTFTAGVIVDFFGNAANYILSSLTFILIVLIIFLYKKSTHQLKKVL